MGVFFYIQCGPNSSPDSLSLLYHMYFYYTQERSLQARTTSVTQLSFRKKSFHFDQTASVLLAHHSGVGKNADILH